MKHAWKPTTPAEMYDRALLYAHDSRLPADCPRPHPTADWPSENIALLEEYVEWLSSGGFSPAVIRTIYLPMAGHVLGLALKPHPQLDLETDLQPGLDFLKAKQLCAGWMDVCRCSILRFRRFLMHRRGLVESKITRYEPEPHTQGLPDWVVSELTRYQHIQQRNWREARLDLRIRSFWSYHLRMWRYLCEQCGVHELADVKRKHLLDFIDWRLNAKYSISGINADIRYFHSFLRFLQEQGYAVPLALLRLQGLKEPDSLPKFLTDAQVRLLRDDLESHVCLAQGFRQKRDALLDRAAFYLLWQSGLRLGEVEELRMEDLDLEQRRFTVRQSKGLKDRTVFMTDTTVLGLQEYLAVRGPGPTDHVFLYRNQALCKDLVRGRLKAVGERVGVKIYPHRLRHTAATQLVNAGCRITSIQKFLGHKELSTTMIYARVHDQTVADDYYTAMSQVEKRLELIGAPASTQEPIAENERAQLLEFTTQLAAPELSTEIRLELVAHIREVLLEKEHIPISLSASLESALA